MRFTLFFTLFLSCLNVVWAQSSSPVTKLTPGTPEQPASRTGTIEKRSEYIRVEDNGARIDELRIGGQTQRIEVQPKGDMPAYQVDPASGDRSWKILGF